MYTRTSPPRNNTIPFEPAATSSPTSVVWDEPALDDECSFDDANNDQQQQLHNFGLPTLNQISSELQTLVKQSALSKASYRGKLGKLTSELHDATKVVQILEQELHAAREKQTMAQRAIEDAKQKREDEGERLLVRKLQLQILRKCMAEPDFVDEIRQIREQQEEMSEDENKYDDFSYTELAVIRRRLEDIVTLLDKAEAAKGSKAFENRGQADAMKREAISTYILFHKYSQI
mmetsp:Transcript_39924/g.110921  ORF Transcript_39924/g.110921 Transcript_39924/m.110921 type:complete len:233 (+) Transcript_39924:116-814(+)